MSQKRILKYREALNEGLAQAMEKNSEIFVMGCGVDDDGGIFGTTKAAFDNFGGNRVIDTPLAENAITGIGVGAALMGKRPVIVHARNDFLFLAMDQIINHAAKWNIMSGGRLHCPLVVRAIVGRGWGQGAQHSQSLQAFFSHVPGLKVIMPSDQIAWRKMATKAPPNPVHSMDAAVVHIPLSGLLSECDIGFDQ